MTLENLRKIAVAKADGLTDEMSGDVANPSRGVRRRPIRKRGFHRAIKRGETWALMEIKMRETMNSLAGQMFASYINDIMKPTGLMGLLIPKPKDLTKE